MEGEFTKEWIRPIFAIAWVGLFITFTLNAALPDSGSQSTFWVIITGSISMICLALGLVDGGSEMREMGLQISVSLLIGWLLAFAAVEQSWVADGATFIPRMAVADVLNVVRNVTLVGLMYCMPAYTIEAIVKWYMSRGVDQDLLVESWHDGE
jgi:hypothetical protein